MDLASPSGRDRVDADIPIVTFVGVAVDQPAPYFGAQDASGAASEPDAGFAPTESYQEFCWAVSVINTRPQPRDEFEEVVVANQYFDAIEPYVVPELQDEWALLMEFTSSIVDGGSFTEQNEIDDGSEFTLALGTINDLVDRECLGR